MCSKFLKYFMELKIFSFLKKITTNQQSKLIVILFVIMMIGLFFAGEIYRAEGISKILIIFISIIYLIISILNYAKGLMGSQADWKNGFGAFYYCLWLVIFILGLLVLIYKFFSYSIRFFLW